MNELGRADRDAARRVPSLAIVGGEIVEGGAEKSDSMGNDSLWYKDAVFYEVHVRAFYDSNGDGIGDFRGLTEKLDYLEQLGVTCIWLLPFFPSPLRDDGYDVADYRGIHADYGTLADFRHFLDEAHRRDLRVIIELVLNHTSDVHPWFLEARSSRTSPRRDWYVWTDDPSQYGGARIIFVDTEQSNWTWDPLSQQYYWHRFFSHQPDLNFDNPAVHDEIIDIMRYWLEMGVDGFRCDAVPYLYEREGTNCENLPETHTFIKKIRTWLDAHYPNAMLLAEANQWPQDVVKYFGDGDEFHVGYHFPIMPRLFMAISQENARPVIDIMESTPDIPPACQWGMFLRNHDELTLEMVSDEERAMMYGCFATHERMRCNIGIRRRLAPLVDNERPTIEVLNAMLLSLPGSPFIYYGDEIAMGENIYLPDRNGVRTPMQWSPDRNAGFSRADAEQLYSPLIANPVYGYQAVNVESQERHPHSLLHWMRRMLRLRKHHRAFSRGDFNFVPSSNPRIIAWRRTCDDSALLCVFNLASTPQSSVLALPSLEGCTLHELMGGAEFPSVRGGECTLTLPQRSFYWLSLAIPETAA
jgi:maltose alpha-D-glucosyltransferase/alpha-amylase